MLSSALRLLARFPDTVTEPVQPSRHGLFSLGGVEAHAAAQQLCGNAQTRGKLILLHRKIKERGGELKLCEIHPTTYDIFRVAHLHDYFDIRTDLNSALASFSS